MINKTAKNNPTVGQLISIFAPFEAVEIYEKHTLKPFYEGTAAKVPSIYWDLEAIYTTTYYIKNTDKPLTMIFIESLDTREEN